jgi:hypothetical protein
MRVVCWFLDSLSRSRHCSPLYYGYHEMDMRYEIGCEVSKRLGPFCFVHIIMVRLHCLSNFLSCFARGNHGGSQWREMPRNN